MRPGSWERKIWEDIKDLIQTDEDGNTPEKAEAPLSGPYRGSQGHRG